MFEISSCTPVHNSSKEDFQNREISDIEKAFISTTYKLIHRLTELPEPISTFLFQRVKYMANPEEPYNATDMFVSDLPFTQLTWAELSSLLI